MDGWMGFCLHLFGRQTSRQSEGLSLKVMNRKEMRKKRPDQAVNVIFN